ncbi:hypothetical protein GSU68_16065 [Rathayibacter sp. VKM Ac-2759]|uniref:hypothetical protein n=1 Tax=Rathayibacter sp. VKM Ac-2759 TaxID=2609252 RepID=UPI0013194D5C|nr:hypothetical protein [Rathayibacter sp. VKM Ac-2759]QHC67933.1 hypothetical protein GSU68_16065 [Rathayibacter sp. VKM Ac-2759]
MGRSRNRIGSTARAGAAIAAALVLTALTGCAATAGAEPAPTVTVTVTAEPDAAALDGGDRSAAYACGRYSSLLSLGWTMQWYFQQGQVTEDAYRQFLERQAFQLTTVQTDDPALTTARTSVTNHLRDAPVTAEGWPYDPEDAEWGGILSDLGTSCSAAGSELASWAEPGMGG